MRAAGVGEAGCRWADGWHLYLGSADKAAHPYAAPLGSRRLGGIPPRSIVTSDTCPMRDESVAYGRRLTECGVQVEAHVVREEGDPVLPGTDLPLWAHNLPRFSPPFSPGDASRRCHNSGLRPLETAMSMLDARNTSTRCPHRDRPGWS